MIIKPNIILYGDCLEIMPFIPDKFAAMILCDLPYGMTACNWDIVLDNCAGSGTTGIACLNTNRRYILIEKKKKYYEVIRKRIWDYFKAVASIPDELYN